MLSAEISRASFAEKHSGAVFFWLSAGEQVNTHIDQDPYRRLVACHFPGSTLVGLDVLTGGVSAQAVSIDIAPADGRGSRFVVRRHSSIDTDRNPHIARDEFALLSALIEAGIPVPKPILFDSSRQLFPEPVIVLAFVQGTTAIPLGMERVSMAKLGAMLAGIHRLDPDALGLGFLETLPAPEVEIRTLLPATSFDRDTRDGIARMLQSAGAFGSAPRAALLHGDFWTGNVLWRDGEIAAVLDWEDALLGDPLMDLAKCRLEISASHGDNAMTWFTDAYRNSSPDTDFLRLPWWDLAMALRMESKVGSWNLPIEEETRFRRAAGLFARRAIQECLTRLAPDDSSVK